MSSDGSSDGSSNTSTDFLWRKESLQDDVFIKSPGKPKHVSMEDTHAYASFGDGEGTTVSVNAHGNIMQISRFLNYGDSGFLCVDPQYEEPYYVQQRMEEILDSSADRTRGLRLDLVDWDAFEPFPSVGFMYDRWPRYIFHNKGTNPAQANEPNDEMAQSSTTMKGTSHSSPAGVHSGPGGSSMNPSELPRGGGAVVTIDSAQVNSPVLTASEMAPVAGKIEQDKAPNLEPAFPLSIQYFCSQGAVVQKYLLNLGSGGVPIDRVQWGPITLDPDICIGDLDFVTSPRDKGKNSVDQYSCNVSKDGHKLFVIRALPPGLTDNLVKSPSTEGNQPSSSFAALTISSFVNGKPAKLDNEYQIRLEQEEGYDRLEVTVVYTPRVFEQGNIDILKELQASTDSESVGQIPMAKVFKDKSSFRRIFFAPSPRSDFVFRRNLEHILSVCSIPIPSEPGTGAKVTAPSFEGPAIAITCGDVAGHRIASRASLSAVQFLCSVLKYLGSTSEALRLRTRKAYLSAAKNSSDKGATNWDPAPATLQQQSNLDDDYVINLRSRIIQVLKGHILWLCQKADPWEDETFAPHYWATGRAINNLDYLSAASLVDTPLQLLKVLHCLDTNQVICEDDCIWIYGALRCRLDFWLKSLHVSNQRGTYAFSRSTKDDNENEELYAQIPDPKFSLADHVLISMAFDCMQRLSDAAIKLVYAPLSFEASSLEKFRCYYTYEEVRRKTLKRFTTRDSISRQKMFATSRWCDKTRFLLHSKDTILFSAANMGFFQTSKTISSNRKEAARSSTATAWRSADERWTKLLDAQTYQDEFQDLEWNKPLWYTIVYVLGSKGRRLGNYSSEALIARAHATLLGASWYNGLFPGTLDYNRTPVCYEDEMDRDNHWHATFETCNILWGCDAASNTTTIRLESHNPGSSAISFKDSSKIIQQAPKYVSFLNLSPPKDQLGRIVLSDDWLQSPPAILSFEFEADQRRPRAAAELNNDRDEKAVLVFKKFPTGNAPDKTGIVFDVPRYSLGTELNDLRSWEKPLENLGNQRSVWESKKRIIWLPYRNMTEAEQVYLSCSNVEKDNVVSFYDRHIKAQTFLLDSATAALNEWETELHLSYYSLSSSKDGYLYRLKGHGFLATTAVSFRFSGDFSDRFWTCLLLEHRPGQLAAQSLGKHLLRDTQYGIRGDLDLLKPDKGYGVEERRKRREKDRPTKPWQQRKILELLICSRMLEDLKNNTRNILGAVKSLALRSEKMPAGTKKNEFHDAIEEAKKLQRLGDREEYASIAKQWRKYIQVLNVVEDNLTDNIETMGEWQRREQNRRDQQPRWTERDKRNHFTTILRLTIHTERQTSEIKRLRDDVRSFRESLPGQLESIREDINFRGSQSINLFTYVTVVFLPLGFATGILSMNGLPDHSMSMDLVFTSLAALAITLFLLLNAEFVKGMAGPIAEAYRSFVHFLCSWGLRQSWQHIKFAVFHHVVKPFMVYRTQYRQCQEGKQRQPKQTSGGQQVSMPYSHHGVRANESSSPEQSILEFSFREAVDDLKEQQLKEEASLEKHAERQTSQNGAASQIPVRVDVMDNREERNLDVEKALGHAAES